MQLVDLTVRADETTGSPPFHFQFRSYLPVTWWCKADIQILIRTREVLLYN